MAQTGYTPIQLYYSTTASQQPSTSNLANGELAINITDGKLYYKDNSGNLQVIGWKTVPPSAGGTGLTSYTVGDTVYYSSGSALSKLPIGANGSYMSSSGTSPQWSNPGALTKTDDTNVTLTLGGSASTALLNSASLTLGWSGQLATSRGGTGLSSFTSNAVVYASNSSNLATSNSFSFDGTNVGIGTSAPTYPLTVGDPTAASNITLLNSLFSTNTSTGVSVLYRKSADSTNGPNVGWAKSRGTAASPTAVNSGDTAATMTFYAYGGSNYRSVANILSGVTTYTSDTNISGYLAFSTNRGSTTVTESGRFDASGNFLLSTTAADPIGARSNGFTWYAPDNVLRIRGSSAPLNIGLNATSGTSIQFFTDNGTAAVGAGNISSNGSSTAYNTSSDYRLKDNQAPLTGSGEFIDALKPKTWTWKADGSKGVGFIAHEVQEVSPNTVVGEKDGKQMQSMEYGSAEFIANMIAELQSLRQRVAQLEKVNKNL